MRVAPRIALLGWVLLVGSASPVRAVRAAGAPWNVLVVLADDLGVDGLAVYGEGADYPVTPTLDALAAQGVLFRNVWSNPVCSPTRATLLTGRYGLRTGLGEVVLETTAGLPLVETTLPELLDLAGSGYAHALVGKWHLGYNALLGGTLAPNVAGFSHFDGTLRGILGEAPGLGYYDWPRTTNGVTVLDQTYNTSALVDAAAAWIAEQTGPWYCFLSFHAPHNPLHVPPRGLYVESLEGLDPSVTPRPFYKAMIEALDTELGRLLASIGPALANTMVVFLGDNGTPPGLTVVPQLAGKEKNTIYEGGVNVPLLVRGPLVAEPGSECVALVNVTDLFATVAEVAGVDAAAALPGVTLDSVSIVPYLADPSRPSLRAYAYTELFEPVGATGFEPPFAQRAVRDARHKLVLKLAEGPEEEAGAALPPGGGALELRGARRQRLALELYDLVSDPYEERNLLRAGPSPADWTALLALGAELQRIFTLP